MLAKEITVVRDRVGVVGSFLDTYTVYKLINVTNPTLGQKVSEEELQKLIEDGINVIIV